MCLFLYIIIICIPNQEKGGDILDYNSSSLRGSYKLSADIIKKLTARELTDRNGNTSSGSTKLMIGTMIYFSHICSPSGHISDLKISELSLVLRCSKRSTFNVLKDLEDKGFISMSQNLWNGYRDIDIMNNDFSSHHDNVRYLNTNRDFFDYRSNEGYDKFMSLSLFAMRLFLLILLNYNEKNGYHVSHDTLCAQLKIKNRSLIHKYLIELKDIVGTLFIERKNPVKKLRYGSINIHSKADILTPQYGLRNNQDSYYNYHWKALLRKNDIEIPPEEGTIHYQAGRLCAVVSNFLDKHLSLTLIENTIFSIITDYGILNKHTYNDIYTRLTILSN